MSTPVTHDHWLDAVGSHEPSKRQRAFAIVRRWLDSFGFISTSPGKLVAATVLVSIGIFAAGYSMSVSSDERQQALDTLITNTEPMAYASHSVYSSLSIADTTAATGFVQAGVEDPANRERYSEAIRLASVSLAEAAAKQNEDTAPLILTVQQHLPVYTGLVEAARANNRVGNPVGAAYMAEASALMREQILPAASTLYLKTSDEMATQQEQLTRVQWIPISGLVAAVILLVIIQWWLFTMTRRRLNIGFVVATVLMVAATAWVGTANWMNWSAGSAAYKQASGPLFSLTNARIQAQKARTEETLALVHRQNLDPSDSTFVQASKRVSEALDEFEQSSLNEQVSDANTLATARTNLESWTKHHRSLLDAQRTGDHQAAVLHTSGKPSSFDALDQSLAALMGKARTSLRSYISEGLSATRLVATPVLILSLLSVFAVWIGIRPRFQEYL
ncbi:MCP four helix bundle domain-containing protein [Corynebacterium freiburgense]|nr:MCP four helix bundle domain-containing protein [Corynebacterium freiburgense]WJZ03746.1 Four helix bundle sensory module for signal transduction [Corynebacterium freiburgense]